MSTIFRCLCVSSVLLVVYVNKVRCYEDAPSDMLATASDGATRLDYDSQWRTLTTTVASAAGILQQEGRNEDEPPLPMRRRRKRKRRPRPDLYSTSEDGTLHYKISPPNSNLDPPDDLNSFLATPAALIKRDPVLYTPRPTGGSRTTFPKKRYRVPYSQSRKMQSRYQPVTRQPQVKEETTQEITISTTPSTSAGDLRSILKQRQSSGLSLSEVLQQRNLTLSDLIKGKRKALSALAEPASTVQVKTNSAYGQRLPTVAIRNEVSTELQPPFSNEERKPVIQNWRAKFEGTESSNILFEKPNVRFEQSNDGPHSIYSGREDEGIKQMLRFEGDKNSKTPNSESTDTESVNLDMPALNKHEALLYESFGGNTGKSVVVFADEDQESIQTPDPVKTIRFEEELSKVAEKSVLFDLPKQAVNRFQPRRRGNWTRIKFEDDEFRKITTTEFKTTTEKIEASSSVNEERKTTDLPPYGYKTDAVVRSTETSVDFADEPKIEPLSVDFHDETEEEQTTPYETTESNERTEETSEDFDETTKGFEAVKEHGAEEQTTDENEQEIYPTEADDSIEEESTTQDEREQTDSFEFTTVPMTPEKQTEVSSNRDTISTITYVETTTTKTESTNLPESLKLSSPRDETANTREYERGHILEVLNSRNGNRLRRILNERNMTLDELLDHRERGSSQLHLADVERRLTEETNRRKSIMTTTTRRPRDPASVEREVAMFENFPNFDLSKMRGVRLSESDSETADSMLSPAISRVKPPADFIKRSRSMSSEKNNPTTVSVFPTRGTRKYSRSSRITYSTATSKEEKTVFERLSTPSLSQHIIDDQISDTSSGILHVDIADGKDYKTIELPVTRYSYLETLGVRSAIIASSVIVGLSILIFLAILIACRWRQKSKNKLRYNNRLMFGKGRMPILQQGSKRHLSPILVSSRSRNSKLNTLDTRSRKNIQEYLWNHFKKTFH